MNILTRTVDLFIILLILAGDQDSLETVTGDESRVDNLDDPCGHPFQPSLKIAVRFLPKVS